MAYVGHKVATATQAVSKVDPIIADIKNQIGEIINKAGDKARAKPKASSTVKPEAPNMQLLEPLSSNIGNMVANMLMQFIGRNVTSPIATAATSYAVDVIVEKFDEH